MPSKNNATHSGVVGWSASLDVLVVVVFVLIGRSSHREGFSLAGTLDTAWPFLAGLCLGWLAAGAWRHPRAIVWTGLAIWAVTVAGGLAIRAITGQGVQLSFAVVTTISLGLFLIGWRAAAIVLERRRSRTA